VHPHERTADRGARIARPGELGEEVVVFVEFDFRPLGDRPRAPKEVVRGERA
jgi:hypothetical protein